jgi:hypothetical protein
MYYPVSLVYDAEFYVNIAFAANPLLQCHDQATLGLGNPTILLLNIMISDYSCRGQCFSLFLSSWESPKFHPHQVFPVFIWEPTAEKKKRSAR